MKVVVDEDMCLGCGICEGVAPEIFSLASQVHAVILLDPVPETFRALVKDAIEKCPEEAISIAGE